MPRNKFESVIYTFPPEARAEIDKLIEQHSSGTAILSTLRQKYSGIIPSVPSLPTVLRYIKHYRFEKDNISKHIVNEKITCQYGDGLAEIDNILININEGKEPRINKVKVLEGLAAKCLQRIQYLEDEEALSKTDKNRSKFDSKGAEASIVRYVMEVKSILDTSHKLSKEVQEDDKVILQIIRNESQGLLEVIKEIILDICPDQFELFKEKLKLKLQDRGIVIDVVSESANKDSLPQLTETIERVLDSRNDGAINAVTATLIDKADIPGVVDVVANEIPSKITESSEELRKMVKENTNGKQPTETENI